MSSLCWSRETTGGVLGGCCVGVFPALRLKAGSLNPFLVRFPGVLETEHSLSGSDLLDGTPRRGSGILSVLPHTPISSQF